LFGGSVFLFIGHFRGIDGLAIDIGRECHFVAFIGWLRCSPGGIRNWVIDDSGSFAIVAIDSYIAINSQDGRETAAQVLGSLGARLTANIDCSRIDTDVTITQVVNQAGGDHGTSHFAVAIGFHNFFVAGLVVGHFTSICNASHNSGHNFIGSSFTELDFADLGAATIVIGVGFEVDNAVVVLDEFVGTSAHWGGGQAFLLGEIAKVKSEHVVLIIVFGGITIVVQGGDVETKDRVDRRGFVTIGGHFHGVVIDLLDASDIRNTFGAHGFVFRTPLANEITLSIREDIHTVCRFVGEGSFNVISISSHHFGIVVIEGWEGLNQIIDSSGTSSLEDDWICAVFNSDRFFAFSNFSAADEASKAPHAHGIGHFLAFGHFIPNSTIKVLRGEIIIAIVGNNIVVDALNFGFHTSFQACPDIVLHFLCPGIGVSMLMIHTGSIDVLKHLEVLVINLGSSLGLIVLQANDWVRTEGGGANIGRIQKGVVGEDHIIGGHRLTIGELHTHAQAGSVLGGVAGFVVFDFDVSRTFVEIIHTVVVVGLTLDRIVDNAAHAVGGHDANLGQVSNVHVVTCVCKEGAELL